MAHLQRRNAYEDNNCYKLPGSCQTDCVLRAGHISWTFQIRFTNFIQLHTRRAGRGYSRVTSTKSPSFCTTAFIASLTNLTAFLPQSPDCSCYVNRPILAPTLLWLQQRTDLCAHDFAHSPGLWHQPRLANVTCPWNRRFCWINKAVQENLREDDKMYWRRRQAVTPGDGRVYRMFWCMKLLCL